MIALEDITKCTGCTACSAICPTQCIDMKKNDHGFLYPVIDRDICNDCGLCTQICPENMVEDKTIKKEPNVFAVKHKSDSVRFNSSSGGFFTALYEHIINSGGVVFGVQFDEQMHVVHSKAATIEDCEKFRGSKYVQSTKGNVFDEVKKELKKGTIVLFTGTPCEVAGLSAYLKTSYKNLITADFICHGVPSPGLWNEYVMFLSQNTNNSLTSFCFRDKSFGWHKATAKLGFSSGKSVITPLSYQNFGYLFGSRLAMRPSCFSCRYSNLNRPSDITMGDFWTIGNVSSSFDDDKGISQILINTPTGEKVFSQIRPQFNCIRAKIEDSLQPNLKMPTPMNNKSTKFWEDYTSKGFEYIIKKYKPRYVLIKKKLEKVGLLELAINLKKKIRN